MVKSVVGKPLVSRIVLKIVSKKCYWQECDKIGNDFIYFLAKHNQ